MRTQIWLACALCALASLAVRVSADVKAYLPSGLSYTFSSMQAVFGGDLSRNGNTFLLQTVNSSAGGFADGCGSLNVTSNSTTAVLLIRGNCDFDIKALNAQSAGFGAAIIFDNVKEGLFEMGGDDPDVLIPTVLVSLSSGLSLLSFTFGTLVTITPDAAIVWPPFVITFTAVLACTFFTMTLFLLWRRRRFSRRFAVLASAPALPSIDVEKIPTRTVVLNDTAGQCCICISDYKLGETLTILPCNHEFHKSCIASWLTRGARTCPLCKRDPIPCENTPLLA